MTPIRGIDYKGVQKTCGIVSTRTSCARPLEMPEMLIFCQVKCARSNSFWPYDVMKLLQTWSTPQYIDVSSILVLFQFFGSRWGGGREFGRKSS